jgi:hypothetical protein
MMGRVYSIVAAALIASLTGCGSGKPWDTVAVSGKLTYDDGSPIRASSIKLYFAPQTPPADAKTFPKQGSVGVNSADGTFDNITTYKYGDGLIPGKHKVVIAAYDGGRDLSPKVPKEYTTVATTPLEVDTADSPLEIKIRKP